MSGEVCVVCGFINFQNPNIVVSPVVVAGVEILETRIFGCDEILWAEIAFPSAHSALRDWHAGREQPVAIPARNPAG